MALILIVEDDRGILLLLQEILVTEGYRTVHADNGHEALTLVNRYHPDLILMDLMLPVLDGISAIRFLKANPETWSIPIIAMSAKSGLLNELQNEQELSAAGTLAKPFDLREFIELVDGCLDTYEV